MTEQRKVKKDKKNKSNKANRIIYFKTYRIKN